jgi:hypothetical protein
VTKNWMLTRHNLKKRGWKDKDLWVLCVAIELLEHLWSFFCPLAKYVFIVACVSLRVKSEPSSFGDLYQRLFVASSIHKRILMIDTSTVFRTIWIKIRPGDPTDVVLYLCHFWMNGRCCRKMLYERAADAGARKMANAAMKSSVLSWLESSHLEALRPAELMSSWKCYCLVCKNASRCASEHAC